METIPIIEQTRGGLVSLLKTVDEIGRVHSFERYAPTQDGIHKYYLWRDPHGQDRVRGWYLHHDSSDRRTSGSSDWKVRDRWFLVGYLGLSDEAQSFVSTSVLASVIAQTLQQQPNLLQEPDGPLLDSGVDLISNITVSFCGVLCHRAKMGFYYQYKERQ